jgi:hypothetical protein
MTNTNSIFALSFLSLVLAAGCGADPETAGETQARLVTQLDLEDGTRLEFFEAGPGELTIVATGRSEEHRDTVDSLHEQGLTITEIYSHLSGEAPPEALMEADRRALEARDAAEAEAKSRPDDRTIGAQSQAISADDFREAYCKTSSYWNYKYCFTNRTIVTNVEAFTTSLYCRTNVEAGQVLFSFRTFDYVFWSGTAEVVSAGYWRRQYSYGYATYRQCSLTPLVGARYHASIYGRLF